MATIPIPPAERKLSPAFADALRVEVATLQAKHPVLADAIGRANALLHEGRFFPEEDGQTAVVTASKGSGTYVVTSAHCVCPDATHRPESPCKHRLAFRLYQRVSEGLAHPPTVLDDLWGMPEPPPLPEAEGETPPQAMAHGLERSAQVGLLMGALARAQARMHNPVFDSQNPHFRNQYASLAAVRDAVIPVLAAEGIAVTQLPTTPEAGWITLTTCLWHESGQYLWSSMRLKAPKDDNQGLGSALTYARRYSLQAICGVAGDEDDDAEAIRPVTKQGGRAA